MAPDSPSRRFALLPWHPTALWMVRWGGRYLNEFGFVMIVGVLLDTFVVRTVVVPCVLSLGGWLNWWPRKMPRAAGESLFLSTPLQPAAADVVFLGRRGKMDVGGEGGM